MKKSKKLITSVAMSVGLLAGSIAASAPAQAAVPTYYGGGYLTIGPCLTEQRALAQNRNYRITRSCYYTPRPGGSGIPFYFFLYQPAY